MTAGSSIGFQPHPIEPSDIHKFREFQRYQRETVSNTFFNNTRFKIPDKKSMIKIYNDGEYGNRNRRQ
tara:strand:+ start:2070 stop:2273 length:204 start_codon:yes stop_codon:yes gene_type:complete